jgi:hypothetical protein
VDFTEKYLLAFEEELEKAKHPEGLVKAMKARFPSADLLLSVERGAKANAKHQGPRVRMPGLTLYRPSSSRMFFRLE